jgi:WD40 repeat protein
MNIRHLILFFSLIFSYQAVQAQYFGKNKPQYEKFDFSLYQTPHFAIYHYLNDRDHLNRLAKYSEDWYKAHQTLLKDTFQQRNPILFYNNHADFQQTNAISGPIGVGTGGVTEGLKNRVIMPLAESEQQTHHVLGHELVHAFQYKMILGDDSLGMQNLGNLPLYMVEGLAEYMSIGRYDSHTAMWMRDAVLNEDVPSIKDLSNPEYFPYRYGQAFWAFITSLYGDHAIKPFFMNTAKVGLERSIKLTFGLTQEDLSELWVNALKNHFRPHVRDLDNDPIGKTIVDEENGGELNVSPIISPNGKYMMFLSEKNVLSLDLYLADAQTGEILEKITSTTRDAHIDNISYLESTGTWSPDSKRFAFVGFAKGDNKLIIREAASGTTEDEFFVEGVSSFNNPSWSPDGRYIVVNGQVDGQSDLFLVNLRTKNVRRLTDDRYAELQPKWIDTETIVFSTDELSMKRGRINGKWTFNIAKMNALSGEKQVYDFFYGADNLNPVPDAQGNLWFLSNRDGYRNMYVYKPGEEQLYQMTKLPVGISGITQYSSALSVSKKREKVLYTYYNNSKYTIEYAKPSAFLWEPVASDAVNMEIAVLPISGADNVASIVDPQLDKIDQMATYSPDSFHQAKFKSRFSLDYIGGGAGGGIGLGGYGVGTGMAGGVNLLFSDITGNHQLFTTLNVNGEIYDIGGVAQYINRSNRISWGVSLSHIPFRTGAQSFVQDTLQDFGVVPAIRTDLVRIYQDQLGVFAQYPFNRVFRVEASMAGTYNYFRYDQYTDYYTPNGSYIGSDRERIEIGDRINIGGITYEKGFLYNTDVAFVGDNSTFGMTSPLAGYRMRIGVSNYFGQYDFQTYLADLRRYFFAKPFSFALRAMHYSRDGVDARRFYPIYLGQMGMVRGLNFNSAADFKNRYDISIDELAGSKFFLAGGEVRLPFTGPERLALIPSGFLFTQLAVFIDAGVAFNDYSEVFDRDRPDDANLAPIIATAGVSMRVNLFNALILEPYYAWPLRENSKGVFGLNLIPGW